MPDTPESLNTVILITQSNEIPQWVKGVFVYWAEGNISDQELINAISFLVRSGAINVN